MNRMKPHFFFTNFNDELRWLWNSVYISYLGLATDQFMETHNILFLCYGGFNMPYNKNSTFTEYKFAFLLLQSAKLNF